jgi:hypothetical protein
MEDRIMLYAVIQLGSNRIVEASSPAEAVANFLVLPPAREVQRAVGEQYGMAYWNDAKKAVEFRVKWNGIDLDGWGDIGTKDLAEKAEVIGLKAIIMPPPEPHVVLTAGEVVDLAKHLQILAPKRLKADGSKMDLNRFGKITEGKWIEDGCEMVRLLVDKCRYLYSCEAGGENPQLRSGWPKLKLVTKTTAEKIADRFHNDGSCFEDDIGTRLEAVCAYVGEQLDVHFDAERHTFEDGSVITVQDAAWDLGFPDCWCWQVAGHSDGCTEAENAK